MSFILSVCGNNYSIMLGRVAKTHMGINNAVNHFLKFRVCFCLIHEIRIAVYIWKVKACDGQETMKNGELYIPVKKDYKKVFNINDNVCIGFAGDTAIVKQFVSDLNNYKNSTICLSLAYYHKRTPSLYFKLFFH